MNYVKTYEGFFRKFKDLLITSYDIGDYVILKPELIPSGLALGSKNGITNKSKLHVRIIEINKLGTKHYKGEFYNNVTILFSNADVLRKMTEDEIEKYELKKTAKKYNL